MVKKFTLSLLSLLFLYLPLWSFNEDDCQYHLSICGFFQNESSWLKEWIEYHRLVGVEHFWLYNNNSEDDYLKILSPYIEKGIVELIDWPSPPGNYWGPYQRSAYNHCIENTKGKTRWLAVIDVDEFIVPAHHDNLQTLLAEYEDYGGLQIFWQMFGTSKVKELSPHQMMIETLLYRAERKHPMNKFFKTICKPHRVKTFFVHSAEYEPPFMGVFPHKLSGHHQPIHTSLVQINHYWTRTENYFLNEKMVRKARREKITITSEMAETLLQKFDQEYNQVLDSKILRFAPLLKSKLYSNELLN